MSIPLSRWLTAICVSTLISVTPQVQAKGDYLLATASTGGTYYPVGVALSTLIKVKLQPKQKINPKATK